MTELPKCYRCGQPYQDGSCGCKDGICLIHGDCRDVLPGLEKVDLVLTDPPYGMNYNTNGNRFTKGGRDMHSRSLSRIVGDDEPFDPRPWLAMGDAILWGFNHFPTHLPAGSALIWLKRTPAAYGQFMSDAEVAWSSIGRGVYAWTDTRHAIACDRVHPAQKPIELMTWCIGKSKTTGTILDPYCGSGTTLRAAKDLGRKAIGIEIELKYVEIAAERLRQEVLCFD